MAAIPPPPPIRPSLKRARKVRDPAVRIYFQRPPRPAPIPTRDDQDEAEVYTRALKKARRVGIVAQEDVVNASLYEHAVKNRILEHLDPEAMAGAPLWATALQQQLAASQAALQQQLAAGQAALQQQLAALTAGQAALQQQLAALQLSFGAKIELDEARRDNAKATVTGPDAQIKCPVNAAGTPLPFYHPTTGRELAALTVAQVNAMLAYYGLAVPGLTVDKRLKLAHHLSAH